MTDDELNDFENKTDEEKIDALETLYRRAVKNDGDFLEDMDFEGEMTVRVLDENGEEKQIQKQEI